MLRPPPRVVFACFVQACCFVVGCDEDWQSDPHRCHPQARGLVINEWLANPQGPDASREWVELKNTSDVPVCLNRAQLRVHSATNTQWRMLLNVGCIAPHGLLLLGDGTDATRAMAKGHPVDVTLGALTLPNTSATLEVACQQSILAQVVYGASAGSNEMQAPVPVSGRSTARISTPDDTVSFCNVHAPPYDGRDAGTPGENNRSCTLCEERGALRARRDARAGELMIVSVYADPPGPDRDKEWIRIRSVAESPMDLAGLSLEVDAEGSRRKRWTLIDQGCSSIQPGDTLVVPVLAPSSSAKPKRPAWVGPTLPNQNAWYRLVVENEVVTHARVAAPVRHACVLPEKQAHP